MVPECQRVWIEEDCSSEAPTVVEPAAEEHELAASNLRMMVALTENLEKMLAVLVLTSFAAWLLTSLGSLSTCAGAEDSENLIINFLKLEYTNGSYLQLLFW